MVSSDSVAAGSTLKMENCFTTLRPLVSRHPVILLEFNELSPTLMERFIGEGKLPTFARFYRESLVYTTEADGRIDDDDLDPWVQWVTVHCGISGREHRILHLGDGHNLREKNVWDLISDSGKKVWVCGSMNLQYHSPIRGWVLPDPWTTEVAPHPADELTPYLRFVSANVRDHTLDQASLTAADKLHFVRFMARHGLSRESIVAIARQLGSELVDAKRTRWRRSVILDKLQFDLFSWVYRQQQPDFSTFFANSTAHLQHVYWRHLEPERFHVKPAQEEQAIYDRAVLFGYQQMDELLGRFVRLAGDDATLVFCTALSQQPCLVYEDSGGMRWYRPRDFEGFLRDVGISMPAHVAPVMADQFQIDFETEPAAAAAEARLKALRYPPHSRAMLVMRNDRRIFAGCLVVGDVADDAVLSIDGTDHMIPFYQLFYRVEGLKSGMHHPDGMLWIRTPARRHHVEARKVPLVSVAPTVLEMFGIPKPDYMKGEPLLQAPQRAA